MNMHARLAQVRRALVVTTAVLVYLVTLVLGLAVSFPLLAFLGWSHLDSSRAVQASYLITAFLVIAVTAYVALRVARTVEQNPLLVALVAVAIGAAIGLSTKPSQLEQQVIGPTRDRMLEQAQQLAKDAAKVLTTTAAATAATAMVAHAASNATSQTAPLSTEDEA
jgi:hypothetical protein